MKILILEDAKYRIEDFKERFSELEKQVHLIKAKFTDNTKDFLAAMSKEKFDLVFMDHDLDDEVYVDSAKENTGGFAAEMLKLKPSLKGSAKFYIHSLNNAGAKYMKERVPEAKLVPYLWIPEMFHSHIRLPNENKIQN